MAKASQTKTTSSKPRKPRAKFRPTFRDRCIYSFSQSLESLGDIREQLSEQSPKPELLGITFMSAYRSLSHSIEMLCKATLVQRSPYLVLDKISYFDKLRPEVDWAEEHTCVGHVALARASKIFKKKNIQNDDLGKLKHIMDSRNRAEHNEFFIQNFEKEVHYLVSASKIVIGIYDAQFRDTKLIEEASQFASIDIKDVLDRASKEISSEFKRISKTVNELQKQGAIFTFCRNCYYDFAQLSKNKKAYKCLWCDDERVVRDCAIQPCKNQVWTSQDATLVKCDRHELLGDLINIPQMIDFASGSALNNATSILTGSIWGSMLKKLGEVESKPLESQDGGNNSANPFLPKPKGGK